MILSIVISYGLMVVWSSRLRGSGTTASVGGVIPNRWAEHGMILNYSVDIVIKTEPHK